MKLLLLTNEFALPVNAGGVRRQLGLVEALAARHDVHMLAREREADTPVELVVELRRRLGAPVESFPARPATWDTGKVATAQRWGRAIRRGAPTWTERALSGELIARARELAPGFDAAITLDDTAHTYVEYAGSLVPFVLDKHNVLAWSRRVEGGLRPSARLEHRLLAQWEARTVDRAGAVVVTSDDEAERFRGLYGGAPTVVPSCIPPPVAVAAPADAPPAFVWLGDHRYGPNADGLLRFLRGAWEPLGAAGAQLLIAGRDPSAEVRELERLPGVEILGFVDDLGALLGRCRGAVAPVWEGAGIKMKTLELMGAGLPLAGTTVSFEGIAVQDGSDGLVADDEAGLGAALRRLVDDPALAARIGEAAHATILRDHTWDSVVGRYDDALREATGV
ncbi:MAG: glycosyltransferase [Solirubrobacteraceae bacterium]|nr:glycosyltransferase [Solirubrobacteraceae bacterium]